MLKWFLAEHIWRTDLTVINWDLGSYLFWLQLSATMDIQIPHELSHVERYKLHHVCFRCFLLYNVSNGIHITDCLISDYVNHAHLG